MRCTTLLRGAMMPAAFASAAPAGALNVPVAGRVVAFVQPSVTGSVAAAIVFQPGNAASEAEADQIERQVGRGMAAGKALLRVQRVPATDLDGLAGKRLAFVTVGVRNLAELADTARRLSVLTVTSDLGCVQSGRCMVAVSGGNAQITVNRAAAAGARIRFGSAFLMLVKEV